MNSKAASIDNKAVSNKFSIVITTYNRLSFLKLAISSALEQTLSCEVVVIDDGSDDGTREHLNSLGKRIKYYVNPTQKGRAASINKGVEIARGNWIKLLDDDDLLFPNCIEEFAKAVFSYREVAIASCQAIRVDCLHTKLDFTPPVGSGEVCHVPQEDIHYRMLLEYLPFGTTVQVAFRKDAFLKAKGWNTQLPIGGCANIDSWVRIAQYGDAVFVNQRLSSRMLWSGSAGKKLSLKERLEANILLKQTIYPLVHPKYRNQLPKRRELQNFLKLHWALVGLSHGLIAQGLQIATQSAIFSPHAWMRLAREIWQRKVKVLNGKFVNFDETLGARLKTSEPLALEYYRLSIRALLSESNTDALLSESEADFMGTILEKAASDRILGLLLSEVDYIVAKELNFLEEDDPTYYQEQREKILAEILSKISILRDSQDRNCKANGVKKSNKIVAFDYLQEIQSYNLD